MIEIQIPPNCSGFGVSQLETSRHISSVSRWLPPFKVWAKPSAMSPRCYSASPPPTPCGPMSPRTRKRCVMIHPPGPAYLSRPSHPVTPTTTTSASTTAASAAAADRAHRYGGRSGCVAGLEGADWSSRGPDQSCPSGLIGQEWSDGDRCRFGH